MYCYFSPSSSKYDPNRKYLYCLLALHFLCSKQVLDICWLFLHCTQQLMNNTFSKFSKRGRSCEIMTIVVRKNQLKLAKTDHNNNF